MNKIPEDIQKLFTRREVLRKNKQFDKADAVRKKIESLGYEVTDSPEGSHIEKKSLTPKSPSFITLFGSGEISSIGRRIHEYIFQQLKKDPIHIVIVSTPAGFQPNVQIVEEEIRDFFLEHLPNFHPNVDIIYANTSDEANQEKFLLVR